MRFHWIWSVIAFVALSAAFAFVTLRATRDQSLAANKSKDLELIHTMRFALLTASEAQYASLIAGDSQRTEQIAERSTRSFEELAHARSELRSSLSKEIDPRYMQRVDSYIGILEDLRVKLNTLRSQNTNRKAYNLATRDCLSLLREIDEEIETWLKTDSAESKTIPLGRQTLFEVRLSLLRIQSLLTPHISEPDNEMMNQIETAMQVDQNRVDKALQELSTLGFLPEKRTWLVSKVDEYLKLKVKIIELSRANSNILSESIALNEYRDAYLECEWALVELQKQILALDPVSLIPKGRN